jgi:hypothetical protein
MTNIVTVFMGLESSTVVVRELVGEHLIRKDGH